MRPIYLQMGQKKLEIDLDKISIRNADKFRMKVSDILHSHDPMVKYSTKYPKIEVEDKDEEGNAVLDESGKPKLHLQTDNEWLVYIAEKLVEEAQKRDGEEDEAHKERVFELRMEDEPTRIGYEIVCALCDLLDLKGPTKEEFFSAEETAVLDFVFELLFKHDSKAAERFRVQRPEQATSRLPVLQ